MAHLPAELLDKIISEFTDAIPDTDVFLPKSSLVPLLRVSREWYPIAKPYLYKTISIGSPFETSISENHEHDNSLLLGNGNLADTLINRLRKRYGHEITQDLLCTLEETPGLARLVKTLRIKVPTGFGFSGALNADFTQTAIDIIRLCANIEHLNIHGYHSEKAVALFDALEDKSLVSFYSNKHSSSSEFQRDFSVLLFNAMGRWPRLRNITLFSLPCQYLFIPSFCKPIEVATDRVCPLLEDIKAGALHSNELQALRTLCPNVKKFKFALLGCADPDGLHALSECLQTWAPSLELLCFYVHLNLGGRESQILVESFRFLTGLKDLGVGNIEWDVGWVADLPNLERISCDWDHILFQSLAIYLEDLRKFPKLRVIDVFYTYPIEFEESLEAICHRRDISLIPYGYE